MDDSTRQMLAMISRIGLTADGIDLIALLKEMSKNNYEMWKKSTQDMNEIFKGQAIATDELIKLFETASERIERMDEVQRKLNEEVDRPQGSPDWI